MEFAPINRHYGHGALIKQHAGLPSSLPLPFAVQHTWLEDGLIPEKAIEVMSGFRDVWAWSADDARLYEQRGCRALVGGAPFAYAAAHWQARPGGTPRGTLAFPMHGSRQIEIAGDYAGYVEILQNLPAEFQPVAYCLHPEELGGELDLFLRSRGLKVTSNGASGPAFLLRFIEQMLTYRYATSNVMMTALLYSAYLGRGAFVYGDSFSYTKSNDPYAPLDTLTTRSERKDRLAAIFALDPLDLERQREAAIDIVGQTRPAGWIREQVAASYRQLPLGRVGSAFAWRVRNRIVRVVRSLSV